MSAPFTLEKSWVFSCNNYNASSGAWATDANNVCWAVINAILGLGKWTARLASNGSSLTAPTSASQIVHAATGTSHTWVVFRLPNGSDLLIDFNSSYQHYATIAWSPAGLYTGGTITTAPTATDAVVFINSNQWLGISSTSYATQTHVMTSSDGLHLRVFVYQNGARIATWFAETLADTLSPSPAWAVPMVFRFASDSSLAWSTLYGTSAFSFRWNGTTYSGGCTTEANNGTPVAQINSGVACDWLGGYGASGVGFACYTAGARGRLGRFVDLWIGSSVPSDGDTYPSTGTLYQFAQLGHLIVPWNSAAPVGKS